MPRASACLQADKLVTGWSGNAAVGVNYGAKTVDIAAPGQDIFSTYIVDGSTGACMT